MQLPIFNVEVVSQKARMLQSDNSPREGVMQFLDTADLGLVIPYTKELDAASTMSATGFGPSQPRNWMTASAAKRSFAGQVASDRFGSKAALKHNG